jgi:hypothetical protein
MSRRNRTKSRGRNATRTKSMKGGDASTYVLGRFGNGEQQFDNTFENGGIHSNAIYPLGMSGPGSMGGGAKKKTRSRRGKKGGFFGLEPIISQALVPFSLFGLQKYLK